MDTLLSVGLLALFGAVVLMIVKWRRRPTATTTRYVPPPAPTSKSMPPRPSAAIDVRAGREKEAREKGWSIYGSGQYDSIENEYEAGDEGFALAASGFTAEQVARAASVRKWHPYWKEGLSSFIYHYTDLLDADENLIAQQSEWEDIRD